MCCRKLGDVTPGRMIIIIVRLVVSERWFQKSAEMTFFDGLYSPATVYAEQTVKPDSILVNNAIG